MYEFGKRLEQSVPYRLRQAVAGFRPVEGEGWRPIWQAENPIKNTVSLGRYVAIGQGFDAGAWGWLAYLPEGASRAVFPFPLSQSRLKKRRAKRRERPAITMAVHFFAALKQKKARQRRA